MFSATKTAAFFIFCYFAALAAANPVPSPPTGKAAAAPTADMCWTPANCK
ncbi:hypothetical protein C8Q78DRAFT_1077816 [Trametes maxima]|nr:hypothetical protein C8Q78DRAFT_1077816 [Trametes maxima]